MRPTMGHNTTHTGILLLFMMLAFGASEMHGNESETPLLRESRRLAQSGEIDKVIALLESDTAVTERERLCDALLDDCDRLCPTDSNENRGPSLDMLKWPRRTMPPAQSDAQEAIAIAQAIAPPAPTPTASTAEQEPQALRAYADVARRIRTCAERCLLDSGDSAAWQRIVARANQVVNKVEQRVEDSVYREVFAPQLALANKQLWGLWQARTTPSHPATDSPAEPQKAIAVGVCLSLSRCLPFVEQAAPQWRRTYLEALASLRDLTTDTPLQSIAVLAVLSEPVGKGLPQEIGLTTSVTPDAVRSRKAANHLLLLNRLTHDPSNIAMLRKLFAETDLSAIPAADAESAAALVTILSNAAYRVAPEHVPEVLAMLEQADLAAKTASGAESPTPLVPPVLAEDLDAIDEMLGVLQEDVKSFVSKRRELAALTEQLSEYSTATALAPETRSRIDGLLAHCIEAEQARNTLRYLGASMARLEELRTKDWPDENLEEANSVLAASEQLLTSFWGIGNGSLRGDVASHCRQLPQKLGQWRDDLLYAKSRTGLRKLRAVADKFNNINGTPIYGSPLNDKITQLEPLLRESELLFVRLASQRAQEEAQPTLQQLQKMLVDLKRQQLNRYQHDAISKCKNVLSSFQKEWYCTEAEARQLFTANQLASIDQSLLTPEVSRCFNDCIGKLFAKMSPQMLVACEDEMGRPENKRKLEAF